VMLVGTPLPLRGDRPADVPDQPTGNLFLQLYFSNENPLDVWDDRYASLGDELAASGAGRIHRRSIDVIDPQSGNELMQRRIARCGT